MCKLTRIYVLAYVCYHLANLLQKDDSNSISRTNASSSFVIIFQTFYKKIASVGTRARNPRFWMPLFGQKTGFRARMNEIKSGIQCSGRTNASYCMACYHLLYHLANFLQKDSISRTNEDFGRQNETSVVYFRRTFQGFLAVWRAKIARFRGPLLTEFE